MCSLQARSIPRSCWYEFDSPLRGADTCTQFDLVVKADQRPHAHTLHTNMAMMASGVAGQHESSLFDDDNAVLDDDFLNDGQRTPPLHLYSAY